MEGVHTLTGDRQGTWSLSVIRNRRLTFRTHRHRRARSLRCRFGRLPLKPQEQPTMPMKNPPHPGDFIRTEIVEPAGLSVTDRRESASGVPPCPFQFAERQSRPVRRHGVAHRESFRRDDGHAHADASLIRHCANPQAAKGKSACGGFTPLPRFARSARCVLKRVLCATAPS